MAEKEKRYYWLKLKEDYLTSPKIKKLRKLAGGDTLTIIYLKMQLMSISHEGIITFEGIEPSFSEELALKLDEQADDIKLLLSYLTSQNLIESNNDSFMLIEACNNIGSECESAERVRIWREKNSKALQCNNDVTACNAPLISNSISIFISNIFNYWNNKDIIQHKEITKDIEKAIDKALKQYSEDEIKICIDRYAQIINDSNYFFDYKWSLKDFLNRKDGISSFTDEGSKWASYISSKKQSNEYKGDNIFYAIGKEEGIF